MKHGYINCLLSGELRHVKSISKNTVGKKDVVIGWGNKSNTLKAIKFAQQHKLPFIRAEDGFIGYIGHPAKQGHQLSLIT
ncbi:MAG: capsular polysaccharide biosynthesis protein, partial [Pseudoalteromonas sp.]